MTLPQPYDPRDVPVPGDLVRSAKGTLLDVIGFDWGPFGKNATGPTVDVRMSGGDVETGVVTKLGMTMAEWRSAAAGGTVLARGPHRKDPEVVAPVLWQNADGTWRVRQLVLSGPLGVPWPFWKDDGSRAKRKDLDRMAALLQAT